MARNQVNQSGQWGSGVGTPTNQESFDIVGGALSVWTYIGIGFWVLFFLMLALSAISPCNKMSTTLNPTGAFGECDRPRLNPEENNK